MERVPLEIRCQDEGWPGGCQLCCLLLPAAIGDAGNAGKADSGLDEHIRRFELSQGKGNPDSEILPPPTFSNTFIPHTYKYGGQSSWWPTSPGAELCVVTAKTRPSREP